MNEPELLPQALAKVPEDKPGLWHHAPRWRNLAIAAALLTLTAVALPALLPQPDIDAAQNTTIAHVSLATPGSPSIAPSIAPDIAPAANIPLAVDPVTVPVQVQPHHHAALRSVAAAQAAPVCALRQPKGPLPMGLGTIIGLQDPIMVHDDIARREARQGGLIDAHYLDDQRAMVRQDDGRVQAFDVPKGMSVHVGDRVTLQNSYQNMDAPCSYIPILITADQGPPSAKEP